MELYSGKFNIPGFPGQQPLRAFRGWDPASPAPPVRTSIGPGPTLRARIGDKVEITVQNKIDDSLFAYTFDTNSKPGLSSFGCDVSGNGTLYPSQDKFPNCFHGSSTANIHFHGTHTSPDGTGDNVLVQILPDPKQQDWNKFFEQEVFNKPVPLMWHNMPAAYQNQQKSLMATHDTQAAAAAKKNNLPAPEALSPKNAELIAAHQWPEYILGGFPNYFELPDAGAPNYAQPGQKYKAGQAPGTHWYHAHKHGSTSLHMLNGLAGAFVIESIAADGYDQHIRKSFGWGDSYGDHEKILIFQQFDPNQNLERTAKTPKPVSQQVFVNGLLTPTIQMQPGEVQLWRFVNATVGSAGGGIGQAGVIFPDMFTTKGFKFQQTAADGVQFSQENYANQPFLTGKVPSPYPKPTTAPAPPQISLDTPGLILFAGNRADVLVQAPPAATPTPVAFTSNGSTRFFVAVTGLPINPSPVFPPPDWPKQPAFLQDLRKPGPNDRTDPNTPVKFQWQPGTAGPGRNAAGVPPYFMINNKQFGEMGDLVDQCMPLDGLQDWVLENHTIVPHPFHIHINPFQVIRIDKPVSPQPATGGSYTHYAPPNNWVWQDVISIPSAVVSKDANGNPVLDPDGNPVITPGKVTIRQTYLDFTGTYVLHCHILAHEDRGMMQLVRVVPANRYPGGCQGGVPAHH
jgi:FtsP/CotA-like multicopper oxidase with cupredoxin domain